MIQEYLISYEFGFVRRGFLGSFLNLLSDDILYCLFVYSNCYIFNTFYLYLFVLKIYEFSAKSPIDIFLLFSALLTHQIYTVSGGAGNKEIFGLISILVIVYYSQIKINNYIFLECYFLIFHFTYMK